MCHQGARLEEGLQLLGSYPAPLLLGLAFLLKGASQSVVQAALLNGRLLTWLLAALGTLGSGQLANADALLAVLEALAGALSPSAPAGRHIFLHSLLST